MACEVWPVAWPCDITAVPADQLDQAQRLATDLLWALSGYRLGVCDYSEAYRHPSSGACGVPYKDSNGNWRNGGLANCCRVLLAHRPVAAVANVWEFGVLLDPTEYDVENGYLRRRGACWPTVAECDDPPIAVAYSAGVPLPPGAAAAVGEIGCEYLSALQGQPCRLPSRATSITRQGVTVTLDNAAEFSTRGVRLDRRRIGLPITDAWLESVVGFGPRVASRVYSPDLARMSPAVVVQVGP